MVPNQIVQSRIRNGQDSSIGNSEWARFFNRKFGTGKILYSGISKSLVSLETGKILQSGIQNGQDSSIGNSAGDEQARFFNERDVLSVWILWVWTMAMLWACTGEEYMRYKDPKQPVSVRVRDLVGRMTLEEKIGQMVQIDRIAATPDIMKNYYIGSLLSGGGSTPSPRATATDWVNMVNDFQKGSLSARLGIPMIYGIDAVHGHNNVYNATIFPHNIGLGATRDPELVKKIGDATATEVRATGIPYVFAPCIAVCRDPRWGRCYESYSEDPKVVQDMTDIILGLQGEIPNGSRKGVPYVAGKNKVAACAKHFVGDGGTTKGINEYNTVTDMHGLLSLHMPAYYHSIIKGVSTVMVSYSSWNGIKMHANRELVTGFLKGKLKFKGFVISDWQGIDRITSPPHSNYTYSVLAGVHAGIDMFMLPFNFTEFINDLTYLVKNNFISMDRIDYAVKRILLVKFKLGLFENPLADLSLVNEVGSQAHRNLAREAVRKSLVLLKNGKTANEALLPLPKKASRILIAGSHADNLGYQCGGWTIAWQGFRGNNGTSGTTILGAVNSAVDKDTQVIYLENPNSEYLKSNPFDYAIVVVGEYPYTETVGDSENLTMADPGPDVIKNVCSVLKCVVVLISGRPIVMEPYISAIDALVAAWLPGTEGQGVTDVLFGDYDFIGKLPRTWFRTVDQLPMNVGDLHYDPLFPFGFGLTTKMVVARSVSAGVDRPYVAIVMIFVFFGLCFQGRRNLPRSNVCLYPRRLCSYLLYHLQNCTKTSGRRQIQLQTL
ncbi:Glycosyl hydrolase family protein [Striga hermonthica]|uniref:Glycosyl hydrolase family protein n=1 Tax=Striga hermonthica TaxID=68872 RepID=A0A9N7R2J5_STRHE|nr:Glycosyl hydrolase family protein [Striga hermonthica]